jgi:copper oxidase (laccase) domain-containing protein
VRAAYVERDPGAVEAFSPHGPGKWLADLPKLARRTLARCGVTAVFGGNLCTYSDCARFYSYRRDKVTGRMAALIWRE